MNETKRRIKAYKAALPELKERVMAVALLLVLSLSMMTSATFAWLTLSRAPELSNVNTTVAANGNLEIALVAPNGEKPGESQVGDSSAAEGKSVFAANMTWGNLVNLSDPAYGLDNLTMRPAQLNTAALLDSPLFGAVYGSDGRITQLSSDFGYAIWKPPTEDVPGYFGVSGDYGVRAISSTTIDAPGAAALYYRMLSTAKTLNLSAATLYTNLGNNDKYMPSLATMMGLYMTARMNPSHATLSDPACEMEDIENLRDMYKGFLEAFDTEADAIAAVLNVQLFLMYGENAYTPYTREMVYGTTSAKLTAAGLTVSDFDQFLKDRNVIASDYAKLVKICSEGGVLTWKQSGLNDIVNNLVNVGACTIGADNTPISSIGASNAMGYITGTQEARITNGILYRFEERTGGYIEVKNLGISATVSREVAGFPITVPATVKANIQTTVSRNYSLFNNDMLHTQDMNTGNFQGGVAVAEDTYGLAIDLWVRTNALNSYLTLEGNVLTDTKEVQETVTTPSGEEVTVYTLTRTSVDTDGSELTFTTDLYRQVAADGTVTWYNASNHTPFTLNEGESPAVKITQEEYTTGFEGENRVWGEKDYLSVDATTQGSGSCYVYYADTPEDQARSLALLDAFNVAFVDSEGRLMAEAVMDTEHFYAENGRVIVPLVLSSSSSVLIGTDLNGNELYGITALEQNVATRITAIVYLDGSKLTNDEVLSAADIQGHLNIQFGSSEVLSPIDNERLENKELRVSATVDKTEFDYDTASGDMIVNVTLAVDGDAPKNVTGFFMRAISSTQGSREGMMTFTQNDSGSWTASFKFTSPGEYVLRTVQLDGVDYDLTNPPAVTVKGFGINMLRCERAVENHLSVMSAASSTTADLTLRFATADLSKLPKKVQGRYLRDDGSSVNVDFTLNTTTQEWTGQVVFRTSGNYTLQYLVLDGEYVELDPAFWQTASITLGLRVQVYTTSPHNFVYRGENMADNEKLLGMQVKILDNAGNELQGLNNVKLVYSAKGNSLRTMDADLAWNGGYYAGELTTIGAGTWQFRNVVVGDDVLTTATTSPTFVIQSPDPPEYYDHSTPENQYRPNANATMNAQITNSSAADGAVYALISNGTYEEWVPGVMGNEFTTPAGESATNWSFAVPKVNGYQDGHWTLKQIKIWNVFDKSGNEYTEDDPLLLNVTGDNVTKVVNRVTVTFQAGQSKDYSGAFMQEHTVSGINLDIKDFEGQPIAGVSDVQMTFTYVSGTSSTYGGYTSPSLSNATEGATVTISLQTDDTRIRFVQKDDVTLRYAGQYATTFSFRVNGVEYKYAGNRDDSGNNSKALPANTPVFTVSSTAPTVTVTGVTTGTISVHTGTRGSDGSVAYNETISGNFNTKTDYNAVVFLAANGRSVNVPEVRLTLSGMPISDFTASMVFPNDSDSSYNKTYEFTANNQEKSQTIGGRENGSNGFIGIGASNPKIFPAGKHTVDTISVVYNGMTFTVELSHAVTISQPQIPLYADFVIDNNSYSGSVPGRVYSLNGETITITLPDASEITTQWNEAKTDTVTGTFTTLSNTNTSYYETWDDGCDGAMYQEYVKTVEVTQAEETATTYTRKWTITGWRVGNTTYALGETITITSNQTITAVLSYADSGHETVKYVMTRTKTYYTVGDDVAGTPPNGYQSVTSDPDNGNKDRWTSSNPNIVDTREPKN